MNNQGFDCLVDRRMVTQRMRLKTRYPNIRARFCGPWDRKTLKEGSSIPGGFCCPEVNQAYQHTISPYGGTVMMVWVEDQR
jgi:hypothetical protein